MLKGFDIIVVSDDWGRHPFSCQHIVKYLMASNRILWVNTVGYRKLNFNLYDIKRSFEKICKWFLPNIKRGLREKDNTSDPNLRVINPICLPFGQFAAVRALNAASISWSVRRAKNEWNLFDPILITTLPTVADLIGRLGERLAVYYCVDDFTSWPGVDGKLMRKLEEKLLPMANLVIATSTKLRKTRTNGRRPTTLLTHGVDINHFRSVGKVPTAPEVQDLQRPVVGYYGLVDQRCDLPLLANLAKEMADVTFLIIGPWRVDPTPVAAMPNVRIVGKVAYAQLPSYLAPVSVFILPYVMDELAESINPLKLKEYLATGLPVVASPLPEVIKMRHFLSIACGLEEFRNALRRALASGGAYSKELKNYVMKQSWARKAEEFSNMVEQVMKDS